MKRVFFEDFIVGGPGGLDVYEPEDVRPAVLRVDDRFQGVQVYIGRRLFSASQPRAMR